MNSQPMKVVTNRVAMPGRDDGDGAQDDQGDAGDQERLGAALQPGLEGCHQLGARQDLARHGGSPYWLWPLRGYQTTGSAPGQATTPMETGMKLKHAAAVVVALLVIASLATWMFAGEDPPLQGEPVLEAG